MEKISLYLVDGISVKFTQPGGPLCKFAQSLKVNQFINSKKCNHTPTLISFIIYLAVNCRDFSVIYFYNSQCDDIRELFHYVRTVLIEHFIAIEEKVST